MENLKTSVLRQLLFWKRRFFKFFTCKMEIRATVEGLHWVSLHPSTGRFVLPRLSIFLSFAAFSSLLGGLAGASEENTVTPRAREENQRRDREKA